MSIESRCEQLLLYISVLMSLIRQHIPKHSAVEFKNRETWLTPPVTKGDKHVKATVCPLSVNNNVFMVFLCPLLANRFFKITY